MAHAGKTNANLTASAVREAGRRIEGALGGSSAYRKIEDGFYCVKQGSTLVMITVHPWNTHAVVRLTAQLVKGVTMEVPLALELLQLNCVLRFGAFGFQAQGEVVTYSHTFVDRALASADEFREAIRDFAVIADEYDDRIAARYGGQTMQDLLEEVVIENMRNSDLS
jgi:hypothetical protein